MVGLWSDCQANAECVEDEVCFPAWIIRRISVMLALAKFVLASKLLYEAVAESAAPRSCIGKMIT